MAKIYRLSDKIHLAVDDIKIVISPLSIHQKAEIEDTLRGGNSASLMKASAMAMKYSIKQVTGLEDMEGKPYEPIFDADGYLDDDSIDELFNIEMSDKLVAITMGLVNGIPKEYDLDGVTFITEKEPSRKKKKAASGK